MKTQKDKLELDLIETIKRHQELIKIREGLEEQLFNNCNKNYIRRIFFLRAVVAIDAIIEMTRIEILDEAFWNCDEG